MDTTNKKYIIQGDKILLKFPYNTKTINRIKTLDGYTRNPLKKHWSITYKHYYLPMLKEWGFIPFKPIEVKRTAKIHKTNIEITKENRHPRLHFQTLNSYTFLKGEIKLSGDRNTWYLPNTDNVKELLKEYNYRLEETERKEQVDLKEIILPDEIIKYTSKTGKSFHPFQLEAIKFQQARNGRALIGDEMGTGKTIEVLGYLLANPTLRPALIICKATAKINWLREVREWVPNEFAVVLKGKEESGDISPLFSIYIINYDILHARLQQILREIKPPVIVTDECQAVKNQDAMRTHAFKWLCKGTKEEHETGNFLLDRKKLKILLTSGTPIKSRPDEFFTALNTVAPNEFPTWEWYKGHYCFTGNGFYWSRLRKERMLELHEAVKKVMIRRLKEDVMPELPNKVRTVIPLEIDNRIEYERAEKDFILWVRENFGVNAASAAVRAEQLVYINRMTKLAVQGKLNGLITWISDFLESGEKLITFCTHSFVVSVIRAHFPNSVKVTGGMSGKEKQESIDQFQEDKNTKLFVGNLISAGDSINLTAASNVAFLELGWSPGDHIQAEDRAHRMGQKDSVNCYYLVAEQTIEMYLVKLISEKIKTLGTILDGKEVRNEDVLTGLLKKYKEMEERRE